MKANTDILMARIARSILLGIAVLVILAIAVDSALHASHVMVFFSLVILSILFLTLYVESEKHKLGVSIACLVLGGIYISFYPLDFTWWRFSLYSATLFLAAVLFFASWLAARYWHHRHDGTGHHHIAS